MDEQLENLVITLEEKSKEIESLKKTVRIYLFYISLVLVLCRYNGCDYRSGFGVRLEFKSQFLNAINHIHISIQF